MTLQFFAGKANVPKIAGLNERGRIVGQGHPLARLTDREVELLLELREAGWTYAELAHTFEVSKSSVAMIVRGERRAERAVRWKVVG